MYIYFLFATLFLQASVFNHKSIATENTAEQSEEEKEVNKIIEECASDAHRVTHNHCDRTVHYHYAKSFNHCLMMSGKAKYKGRFTHCVKSKKHNGYSSIALTEERIESEAELNFNKSGLQT